MDGTRFDLMTRSLASLPLGRTMANSLISSLAGAMSVTGVGQRRRAQRAACPTGRVSCRDACVTPWLFAHDAKNCGACGKVCHHGAVCCDGYCIDLTADPGNCGACRDACATGAICLAGECLNA